MAQPAITRGGHARSINDSWMDRATGPHTHEVAHATGTKTASACGSGANTNDPSVKVLAENRLFFEEKIWSRRKKSVYLHLYASSKYMEFIKYWHSPNLENREEANSQKLFDLVSTCINNKAVETVKAAKTRINFSILGKLLKVILQALLIMSGIETNPGPQVWQKKGGYQWRWNKRSNKNQNKKNAKKKAQKNFTSSDHQEILSVLSFNGSCYKSDFLEEANSRGILFVLLQDVRTPADGGFHLFDGNEHYDAFVSKNQTNRNGVAIFIHKKCRFALESLHTPGERLLEVIGVIFPGTKKQTRVKLLSFYAPQNEELSRGGETAWKQLNSRLAIETPDRDTLTVVGTDANGRIANVQVDNYTIGPLCPEGHRATTNGYRLIKALQLGKLIAVNTWFGQQVSNLTFHNAQGDSQIDYLGLDYKRTDIISCKVEENWAPNAFLKTYHKPLICHFKKKKWKNNQGAFVRKNFNEVNNGVTTPSVPEDNPLKHAYRVVKLRAALKCHNENSKKKEEQLSVHQKSNRDNILGLIANMKVLRDTFSTWSDIIPHLLNLLEAHFPHPTAKQAKMEREAANKFATMETELIRCKIAEVTAELLEVSKAINLLKMEEAFRQWKKPDSEGRRTMRLNVNALFQYGVTLSKEKKKLQKKSIVQLAKDKAKTIEIKCEYILDEPKYSNRLEGSWNIVKELKMNEEKKGKPDTFNSHIMGNEGPCFMPQEKAEAFREHIISNFTESENDTLTADQWAAEEEIPAGNLPDKSTQTRISKKTR